MKDMLVGVVAKGKRERGEYYDMRREQEKIEGGEG